MRAPAALLAFLLLAGCDAPRITGIATGLEAGMQAPRRPVVNPAEATFAFEPFTGVPGNVGDDLLRRIWEEAEREGLGVVRRPGGRSLFVVEGTLTAVSDDTNALVFYVFDVKDVNGRRLHRIAGQQASTASEGDPWTRLDNRDLDVIARRLAALLRAWLYSGA